MAVKRRDDVPMGAMWTPAPGDDREQYSHDADLRESASVAHIYGRTLVAAESMTAMSAPWGWVARDAEGRWSTRNSPWG